MPQAAPMTTCPNVPAAHRPHVRAPQAVPAFLMVQITMNCHLAKAGISKNRGKYLELECFERCWPASPRNRDLASTTGAHRRVGAERRHGGDAIINTATRTDTHSTGRHSIHSAAACVRATSQPTRRPRNHTAATQTSATGTTTVYMSCSSKLIGPPYTCCTSSP